MKPAALPGSAHILAAPDSDATMKDIMPTPPSLVSDAQPGHARTSVDQEVTPPQRGRVLRLANMVSS